jgi:lysophospholipase
VKPALESFEPRFIETNDGVRLRAAVWDAAEGLTLRGVCVLLQGQTEFIEKYCEVIDDLRLRGLTVATFDWRGQGGSARVCADTRKCHIDNFTQYDEDLRAFMEQVVRPISRKPIALAHSMGAHILLRHLHDYQNSIASATLCAPMMRVSTRGQPEWIVPWLTRVMMALGRSNAWVFGMEARDPLRIRFDENLVTADRARFARAQKLVREHPDIRLAGPTWGWLSAAFASMNEVMAPGYAEKIETPVLIVGAGRDRIVQTIATREFASRLPHGKYIEIEESEHEILMEKDSIRARFWDAFDAFRASR